MIGMGFVDAVAGLTFLAFAMLSATDREHSKRWGNAAFYALIALSFLGGDRIGDLGNGVLVLGLVALAASGTMGRSQSPAPPPRDAGNGVFLAALVVPAVALAGTLLFRWAPAVVDSKQATFVALCLGVLIALGVGYSWLRPRWTTPFIEGTRLMDSIGWAAVLPQMLASLGAVFALAGVGDVVGGLVGHAIPAGSLVGAVLAYALGMALFTILMGNAFAAFPVMTAAIGIPLLVRQHHGDPAVVAAVGMLSGFCGTLLTPMAANFNLVPAALLGLRDRYAVIRAQAPTALPLLGFNIALLYWMGFR